MRKYVKDKNLYKRYYHILERCYNPKSRLYKNYGGRGIKVCTEWLNSYTAFEDWSYANGYKSELQLDRINNNGDYSPENCRYVTGRINCRNKRSNTRFTINGDTKMLVEWCEEYNISHSTVQQRLKMGFSIEDAITKPVRKRDKTSLIGKKVGRLTVIRFADEITKGAMDSIWVCRCDCGNEILVKGQALKSGHSKSCGCLRSDRAKERMIEDNPMKKRE